jgi:hypothetical protein
VSFSLFSVILDFEMILVSARIERRTLVGWFVEVKFHSKPIISLYSHLFKKAAERRVEE